MPDDDRLWVGQNGEQFGPYSEADVRRWIGEGKFARDALVWRNGMTDWAPLGDLFPAVNEPPPPLPPRSLPPPNRPLPPAFTAPGAMSGESFSAYPESETTAASTHRPTLPPPPALHWGLVLLFTMLTFGIFGVVWPFIQANWVRKIDSHSRASLFIGLALASLVIGYVCYFAGAFAVASGHFGLLALGGMLLLGYWVLYLTAYFSMAGSLRRNLPAYGLPVAIGGVTLFFFNMYYLQGQLSWVARCKNTGQITPPASQRIFWVLLIGPVGIISILAAIAIPAYQDYLVRAQIAASTPLTDNAKIAVVEYYYRTNRLPTDNQSAGLDASTHLSGKYVSSIEVADGKIIVAFNTSSASPALRNDVLVITPYRDSNGRIGWRCADSGTTVPAKYLPLACRQQATALPRQTPAERPTGVSDAF